MRLALSEAEAGHRAGDEARTSVFASDLAAQTPERGEDPPREVVGAVHRVFPWSVDSDVDHQFGLCRLGDGLMEPAHSARLCGTARGQG